MDTNTDLIKKAKKYIEDFNPGNKHAYHNNKHLFFVYDMSLKIFDDWYEKSNESKEVKTTGRLALGLAALFHDFNHSGGGSKPDSENIKNAIIGLGQFIESQKDYDLPWVYDGAISIITSSEFPHKKISDSAILCHIIRDADLLPGICDGWETVVRNICIEMNKTIDQWRPIQTKFISNLLYKTTFAQELYKERKNEVLEKLAILK